jgi:holo-[acyl-carrier protein] synthase
MAKEKNVSKVWLSLTHTKEYAAAQCVMEAEK